MERPLQRGAASPVTAPSLRLAYGWLLFAVLALVFAGIFALMVALARTPVIEDLLPLGSDYIYVALVGHVVMAFIIWFLAFEGFLWVFTSTIFTDTAMFSPLLCRVALGLAAGGTALIVVTALSGLGYAELANYVPFLLHPWFYTGLALFAAGILLNVVNTLLTVIKARREGAALPAATFGMAAAALCALIAFICFGLSGYNHFATEKAFFDFDRFVWGGGHVLQYTNTISMVTVWLMLTTITMGTSAVGERTAKALFALYVAIALTAPFIYYFHDTATQAYKESFTTLKWGLGPSTSVFAVLIIFLLVSKRGTRFEGKGLPWRDPAFSSLVLSMAVFGVGGAIAATMKGVNTMIPAHYHCTIGAVTIAFMGLFYEILPLLDRAVYSTRLARVQPYLYSLGIILFAGGLWIAGSHGVARKTYGAAQNLDTTWKYVGMSIMGLGGLVAIAGGITFVLNAAISMLRRVPAAGGQESAGERWWLAGRQGP
ncbi:MAG TPA: hypothetical protein ENJ37_01520 [Deltaproteobacteria bacterium]|nr:hypothetical protein [Deltaproteobacteria bacterium]